MATAVCASFAATGDLLAVASADGRVRVWDAHSGDMRCELGPDDHSGGQITCLEWKSTRLEVDDVTVSKRKRRKVRSKNDQTIACGSSSGLLIILNVDEGTVDKTMDNHKATVNCVAFCGHRPFLYSGSDDRYIAEWNTDTWEEQGRWKGDKHQVTALCCSLDNSPLLLSAGRTIKLWNTEKRETIKRFSGHANLVRQLQFVPCDVMSHFVSRADNERIINAWSVSSSTPVERNAVTSFSAPEELKQIHVDRHAQQPDSVCLVALSRENSVHIFSHPLNGYHGKPISPKCTVQIAPSSKDQADTLISPLPVLSACLCSLRDESLIIAYGSIIRPVFERLSPVQEERHVCLVRQMDGGWLEGARKRSEHQKPKVKRALSAGHVLGPGQTPLTGHMQQETDLDKQEELTIEERLSLLSVTKANPPTKRSGPPTAESQSQMLVQALHSQDKQLLESVLRTNKERVVEHTVRRLPSTLVVPLIKEVVHRIQSRPTRAAELIVWIRSTLLIHSSYLMTVPGLADSLGTLYSVLDVRRTVYPKLLGLQGRLDVMLSQVSEQANRDEVAANGDPLAVYIEEDSDDDYPTPPALSDHWSDEDSEGQIEDHHEQTRMTDDDDNDRLDGSSDSDIDSKSMVEDG